MTFSTRIIQGPVGRLALTTAGEGGGVPVLFVHDTSGNRTQWAAQQAHVGQHTVSFDLRGMGESESDPMGRYHFRDFAQDVGAVADALGLERFVLVGHGSGCVVVSEYATRHPGRVAGLVLGDPDESLLGLAPEELLSHYPGPCLAISAESTLTQLGPMALHRRVPGLRVTVLRGVSHWLMMDDPEAFNTALDEFLAEVEELLALDDMLPPGPTDATGALSIP
jgi:pimeloyl-ACP methyl ester carboxylesterase